MLIIASILTHFAEGNPIIVNQLSMPVCLNTSFSECVDDQVFSFTHGGWLMLFFCVLLLPPL